MVIIHRKFSGQTSDISGRGPTSIWYSMATILCHTQRRAKTHFLDTFDVWAGTKLMWYLVKKRSLCYVCIQISVWLGSKITKNKLTKQRLFRWLLRWKHGETFFSPLERDRIPLDVHQKERTETHTSHQHKTSLISHYWSSCKIQ